MLGSSLQNEMVLNLRLKFITSASRLPNILPIEVWKESSKAFLLAYIFFWNSSEKWSDPLLADPGQGKEIRGKVPKARVLGFYYLLSGSCLCMLPS